MTPNKLPYVAKLENGQLVQKTAVASNMDINILSLIREGVITLDNLAEFSDELQSHMRLIVERASMIFDDYE